MVDKPDDPRAWMADHVNQNRDKDATSCSRAEVGRDSPVNTAGADSAHPPLATTADATVEKKVGEPAYVNYQNGTGRDLCYGVILCFWDIGSFSLLQSAAM